MSNELKKDWKKITRANGFSIPDSALDRIAQSLDSLETGFRPLARGLRQENEPATVFRCTVPGETPGEWEDAG